MGHSSLVHATTQPTRLDQNRHLPPGVVPRPLGRTATPTRPGQIVTSAEAAVHAAWGLMRSNAWSFIGSVMHDLEMRMGWDRLFSDAYASWTRGSVENAGKVLRDMFRALCSERQFPVHRWDALSDLVMWSYNTAKLGSSHLSR
jgi:hypothetical protein